MKVWNPCNIIFPLFYLAICQLRLEPKMMPKIMQPLHHPSGCCNGSLQHLKGRYYIFIHAHGAILQHNKVIMFPCKNYVHINFDLKKFEFINELLPH